MRQDRHNSDKPQADRHVFHFDGLPEWGDALSSPSAGDHVVGVKLKQARSLIFIWVAALGAATASTPAFAQDALLDPAGSGPLTAAVRWLEGTLLGTIATVAAVIAVATVGFMMLTGRMNWRYGATVVLGCFILFGAASIVAGIHSTASLGQ